MSVVPLHRPPSKTQAQEIIRSLVASGHVRLHPHCQMRRKQRKITYINILNVLAKGYVDEIPYPSPHHQGWETAVVGSAAGERLRVAVALRWQQDILVITCYAL